MRERRGCAGAIRNQRRGKSIVNSFILGKPEDEDDVAMEQSQLSEIKGLEEALGAEIQFL